MSALDRIAAAAEARLARRVAERLGALPGVSAEVAAGRVVLSGPGLARRAVREPALRWVAGWLA